MKNSGQSPTIFVDSFLKIYYYIIVEGYKIMLEILKTDHEDFAKINCPDVSDIVERFVQARIQSRKLFEDIFFDALGCETEEDKESFRKAAISSDLENLAGDFIAAMNTGVVNMINLRPHGFDGAYQDESGKLIEREIKKVLINKKADWEIIFGTGKISEDKALRYNNDKDYILTVALQDDYRQDIFYVSGSSSTLGDTLLRTRGEINIKKLLEKFGFKIILASPNVTKQQVIDIFKKKYKKFVVKDEYFA